MKKVLFSVAILMSFSSSLFAKTIAQLPVRTNQNDAVFVKLHDDGTVTVVRNVFPDADADRVIEERFEDVEVTVDLDERLATKLLFQAIQLSNAELDVRRQDIVCMMVAPPGPSEDLSVRSGYDRHKGFQGKMRTVLTQRGCWSHVHISLEQDHLDNVAFRLIGALEAIGLQALSAN